LRNVRNSGGSTFTSTIAGADFTIGVRTNDGFVGIEY
jgi:hypothetical protein